MKPEAQRLAIAEACGVTSLRTMCPECWGSGRLGSESDSWECEVCKGSGVVAPYYDGKDYLSDLNAMHEAEKTLMHDDHYTFRANLWDITESHGPDEFSGVNGEAHNRRYCSATATQRAEAFLKTKGLWKEGV